MSDSRTTHASRRGDDVTPGRAELVTLVVALLLVLAMVSVIIGLRLSTGDARASISVDASWNTAFAL